MDKKYIIATNAKKEKVSKLLEKIGYKKTLESKGLIPQCGYSINSKKYWELIVIKDIREYNKKVKTVIESEDFHFLYNTSMIDIPSKKKNCLEQLKKDFLGIEKKLKQQGYQTKLY
ncbi:hypothetical protein M0R19_02380 [Candidatus Pacearchaeota archaeon]|jgi:hypothetical protein|nr:hypothetical protein [Candidatus Pacearchaeota archaeon]